jgi:hypothetical protein
MKTFLLLLNLFFALGNQILIYALDFQSKGLNSWSYSFHNQIVTKFLIE